MAKRLSFKGLRSPDATAPSVSLVTNSLQGVRETDAIRSRSPYDIGERRSAEELTGGTMTALHHDRTPSSQPRDRLLIWSGAALISLGLWAAIIMAGAAAVHAVL